MSSLPIIKIKSSQRRFLILVAFTFLVGTMITILNYYQNNFRRRFVISYYDRAALLNYFNQECSKQQSKLIKQNLVANKPTSFAYSEAELNLTQQFIIDKKNYCYNDNGYGPDLLVMVMSSSTNFDARNAIRQTWGGLAVEDGSKLLFVVGRSPFIKINERLKQEDNQFGDILQGQFQDAYHNLTLKSIAMINWAAKNCKKAKYVVKVDDDMFVNMQLLVNFAETKGFRNVIIGKIAKKTKPIRDPESKWYVPFTVYPDQYYPDYALGQAYLIHREAIPNLINVIRSNSTEVLNLEDVFLTGMIAEKAGVSRLNNQLFNDDHLEVTKCNFSQFITSHQHSPKEIKRLWHLVYYDEKTDCNVKEVANTKASNTATTVKQKDQHKNLVSDSHVNLMNQYKNHLKNHLFPSSNSESNTNKNKTIQLTLTNQALNQQSSNLVKLNSKKVNGVNNLLSFSNQVNNEKQSDRSSKLAHNVHKLINKKIKKNHQFK